MTIELPTVAAILAALSLYQGLCWLLDRYKVGEKRQQHMLVVQAQMNMMRELIRATHRDSTLEGWIDEDELEHIESVYSTYHALGGNGTGDRWMDEIRRLPRQAGAKTI